MKLAQTHTPLVATASAKTNKRFNSLSKEQKLFFQLLHNYPDGAISIIDKDFNFAITGGELHKRLGADPSELIGHEIYPKFPASIRKEIKHQLKKVFAGKNISGFELPHIIEGDFFVMDAFPLKETDGSIVHAGVIIRNISSLKTAEAELNISLEKERELSEMKSRFITMASHEFRTPLSTVLTSVQLLHKYVAAGASEKVDKHIGRITNAVHLLNDILNDFLTVGKLQEGRLYVNPQNFDIAQCMEDIVNELSKDDKTQVRISYKHKGKAMVHLDPLVLKYIVVNLLSNAVKFSGKNTMVQLNSISEPGKLIVTIKDQGIGIPPEYEHHLFEQFYRASNATNIQGTGLGLHTVSKYVELMGGTISYTSELEVGTEFIVELPHDTEEN